MPTKDSELEKGKVRIGTKFEQEGRSWEVVNVEISTFKAKTTDNKGKSHVVAHFRYKKEMAS